MRRVIAILIVAAVLLGTLGAAVQAQPNALSAPVTLGANGWSDPTVGSWDGHTATLTADLQRGIVIAVSNVVLDGGGHSVTGAGKGSGRGVYAKQLMGVTVRNLRVSNFDYGIYLEQCGEATVAGNAANGNAYYGIYLKSSSSTTVTGNSAEANADTGIHVSSGGDNVLTNNTVRSNGQHGIYLNRCFRSTLAGNAMDGSPANLRVDGAIDAEYTHTIDTSNTVGGKPVLYLVGVNGGAFDGSSQAGTVYLINCSGITLKGLVLSSNFVGALLWHTSNSRLEGLQASGNQHGIWLRNGSNGNTLAGNTIDGSRSYGVYIEGSSGNTLTGNEIRNSGTYGLYLAGASNNQAVKNRFLANRVHAYGTGGGGNTFNQPKPDGGNFWDDWTAPDNDGDGFVDTPRVFTGGEDDLPVSGAPKVDRVAPVTAAILDGALGGDGWYRSDVRVTLGAVDNEGGSGVKSTEYSLDGGASWQPYTGPFSIGQEGTTALAFRSTDNAGNVEQARSRAVKIDKSAPEITITRPQPGEVLPSGTALSFGARDALSGLAGISASLFDGVNKWAVSSGDAVSQAGVYNLTVLANDVAGNVANQTRSFIVPSLEAASVTGGGWFSTGPGKSAADKAFVNVVCQNRQLPATPVGEFSFRAGDLSLKGSGYRWLVVRDSVAWLEGTGALNGGGNYRFQLVVDTAKRANEPDRVRVRIWDEGGRPVYDSQPGADDWAGPTGSLSGGNITLHKG